MTNSATARHCHGKPQPIRPARRFPIKPQQMLALSLGLLALSLASVLIYFSATGQSPGELALATEQLQRWSWLTHIAFWSLTTSILTMAAAIALFGYTHGKAEENRNLANAHRRYRQRRSRQRRRSAGPSGQNQNDPA